MQHARAGGETKRRGGRDPRGGDRIAGDKRAVTPPGGTDSPAAAWQEKRWRVGDGAVPGEPWEEWSGRGHRQQQKQQQQAASKHRLHQRQQSQQSKRRRRRHTGRQASKAGQGRAARRARLALLYASEDRTVQHEWYASVRACVRA